MQTGSVLMRLSLAAKLEKSLLSLYGTKWNERGYGLWYLAVKEQTVTQTKLFTTYAPLANYWQKLPANLAQISAAVQISLPLQ
jgi:hypothetical protein